MTASQASAAVIRRLLAEISADREALAQRTEEASRFSMAAEAMTPEQVGATSLALERAYTSLEAILERVARTVEGSLPAGDDWHRALLHRTA